MKIHASQMIGVNHEDELFIEADGDKGRVEIIVELVEDVKNRLVYFKPVKAIEYWVQDEPVFDEGEDVLNVGEAVEQFLENVFMPADSDHAEYNGTPVWSCYHDGRLLPLAVPNEEGYGFVTLIRP